MSCQIPTRRALCRFCIHMNLKIPGSDHFPDITFRGKWAPSPMNHAHLTIPPPTRRRHEQPHYVIVATRVFLPPLERTNEMERLKLLTLSLGGEVCCRYRSWRYCDSSHRDWIFWKWMLDGDFLYDGFSHIQRIFLAFTSPVTASQISPVLQTKYNISQYKVCSKLLS